MDEIVDALPAPAAFIAKSERLEAINQKAIALFGQNLIGRHYITALRQPALLDTVSHSLTAQTPGTAPLLLTDDHHDTTWTARLTPIGGGVLLLLEDRTELEEAGQMRRDFVANVSHELRTPLTALMGFIDTLRGPAKDDRAAQERFLGIMSVEAARMNRLIDDLLSLSRVEANERMRPKDNVDLASLLKAVMEAMTPMAKVANVQIRADIPELSARVPADADQLTQVFSNLIENAIKYGGGQVDVALTFDDRCRELRVPSVRVDVVDNGAGIAAIHLPRLTQRFYRIDPHRSREIGGTGLGLAIVKHIIGRHRGRLKIASERGQGSTFSVFLPWQTDAPDEAALS